MRAPGRKEDPEIVLVEGSGDEVTLYIDGDQAMQAWERELMELSADLLTQRPGGRYLECGLGLGLSALRVAARAEQHTVVELYPRVVELFRERHPHAPANLELVVGDFFEHLETVPDASVDGILFDPALEREAWDDEGFWRHVGPHLYRVLRPGGALVPFFSTTLELWTEFAEHFERIELHRRPYRAYDTTVYTKGGTRGHAWVHRLVKEPLAP